MIRIKTLCTTALIMLLFCAFSQQSLLRIQNPERWNRFNGKIDSAKLVIKPVGIYTECDLFLTFSSGDYLTNQIYYYNAQEDDQVEVQYFFKLPEGAIVTDSWLWVEDDIVIADIRERSEANGIYEEIVGRRQDPSILYKNSAIDYELRVYPLIANETRKVKITFLLPNEWINGSVNTSIPLNYLKYSGIENLQLKGLDVVIYEDSTWTNPSLVQSSLSSLSTDTNGKKYRSTVITQDLFSQPLNLSYTAPSTNGFFVQKYASTPNSGYYQMALFPDLFKAEQEKRNVLVAFDHQTSRTNLTDLDVWNTTKNALKANLVEGDSFNVAYTKFVTKLASDTWLPATEEKIDSVFREIWALDPLRSPASLPSLLGSSLDFIESNSVQGSILLVSSSADYFLREDADLFTQDFIAHSDKYPVDIVDYSDLNHPNRLINGTRYYGNSYLYDKLSTLTNGNNISTRGGNSFYGSLIQVLSGASVEGIEVYDVDVNIEGLGFTYSNYALSTGDLIPTKAYLQVGKYYQNGVFEASTFAEVGDEVKFSTARTSDFLWDQEKVTYQIWANQKLKSLESSGQNRGEVVELSLASRVLTSNTAFLALDPNLFDDVNVCNDCDDGPEIISSINNNSLSSEMSLSVFPNPVEDKMNVKIELPKGLSNLKGVLRMVTMDGTLVLEKELENLSQEQVLNLSLSDLNTEIEKGVYLLTLTVGEFTKTIKVTKV